MKVAALILAMFLAAVSAAGQVLTLKNDIPESQYLAAEAKAAELLKTANYRSIWTKEYFDDHTKTGKLKERKLIEIIRPDRKRTVEERFADSRSFVEIIRVEFAQYIRGDDTPWMKFPGIHGFDSGLEVRGKKNQYRSVPSIGFEGGIADFYERRSSGKFQDPAQMVGVYVKGIKTTRIWYSLDGKILKKLEEIMVKGGNQMSRETTTYEHDPKDLKIEAPVVK